MPIQPVTIEMYNPEIHGDFVQNEALRHQCFIDGVMFVATVTTTPDAPPDVAMTVVGRICVFQHSVYTTEIFHAHVEPEYKGKFIIKQLYQHVLNLINTPVVVTGAWLEHERLQRTLTEIGFRRVAQLFSLLSNKQVVCYAKVNDPAVRTDSVPSEEPQTQQISARPTIILPSADEDDDILKN